MRRHVFILLLLYYGTEFATAGLLMRLKPPLSKTDDGLKQQQLKEWTRLILPKREAKALSLYKEVDAEVHHAPNAVELDETPRRPDVLVRFTRESAKFITEDIASAAKEKLVRRRIDNITLSVLQLNITLHSVSIAELVFPTVDYEKISKSKVRASSRGGEVRLQGQYRSVYRTVREGQFEATIRGFNVEVDVGFDRNLDGSIKLVTDECKPSIGSVQAELTPFLLDDVLEAIEKHLLQTVKDRICEYVDLYVRDFDQHLPLANHGQSPFDFEVGFADGERVQRRLRPSTSISLTEDSLNVVMEPAQAKPYPLSPTPLAADEDDTSRMVYVYLSERYTKQLLSHLFVIPNANFKLHGDFAIDAIACDAEDNAPSCKPSLFGPKPLRLCKNTGRLRTWQRKQIDYEATDEGAKLRLQFSAAVTFDNFCAGRPVIVANFDLAADILLESMKLTVSDFTTGNAGVQYIIEPSLYVEHVEVTNPRYFVPMQEELETRIAHEFPVRLMHSVLDNIQQATLRVPAAFGSNATVYFREHTMALSFDLPKTVSVGTPIHL